MCLIMPHLHWKMLSKIAPNTSSRVCFPNIPKHADLALRKNGWVKMVFQEEDTSPPLASRLIQTEHWRKTKFADSKPTICCFRQETTQRWENFTSSSGSILAEKELLEWLRAGQEGSSPETTWAKQPMAKTLHLLLLTPLRVHPEILPPLKEIQEKAIPKVHS